MKTNKTKLDGLDKLNVTFIIDKSKRGQFKAFAVKNQKVLGYISLYLHDKKTYEVNSVVAKHGLGKLMYAVSSMELEKDDIWICASTTNDTNHLAMRVWDSFLKDDSVEKYNHPDIEDNLVDFAIKIKSEDWFEKRRLTDRDIGENILDSYRNQGQKLFDKKFKDAEKIDAFDFD